ncbi:MAG: hypothetical protein ACYC64_06610 [Armatimonadota bacterium]
MKAGIALILGLQLASVMLAPQAHADGYNYFLAFKASTTPGSGGYKTCFMTREGTSAGYDNESLVTFDQNSINLGQYKKTGAGGWNGINGFYVEDVRSPLVIGQSLVGDFYVWAGSGMHNQSIYLYLDNISGISPALTYTLQLIDIPNGVTYTGRPTEWAFGYQSIELPFYSTTDGTTGYKFRVTLSAPVPEASGLSTLISGLVGTVGFALRRRR